jgi:hypothetical protein
VTSASIFIRRCSPFWAAAESARKDAEDAKDKAKKKSELADRKAEEAAEERAKGMQLAGAVKTLAAGPTSRRGLRRGA